MRINLKAAFVALAALFVIAPATPAASPNGSAPKLAFKTGARPSPKAVIASSPKFTRSGKIGSPTQFAAIPGKLSMWGNSRYGCCVTTEEAVAKIADLPNVFITEQTVIDWASRHGVLNGAMLNEVLDMMERDGIQADDGKIYKNGPKLLVDLNDKSALEAAIYQGRVKIGLAADQVMQSVNGTNGESGWYGTSWRRDPNTDHCTSLLGYGPASAMYEALKVPLPAGVPADTYGYLMFTWNSIGFVSRDSLLNVSSEGWTRQPTTAGYPKPPEPVPAPPPPAPAPTPAPAPEPVPAPVPQTVPIWVFAVGAGVLVVIIGGIVFVGRRSAATK